MYKYDTLSEGKRNNDIQYRVRHTPLGRFCMHDISTIEKVSVPNRSALQTFRRELYEDVSFGIGTLLVVEQSGLENHPKGRYIYHRIRNMSLLRVDYTACSVLDLETPL